mmetsp:Transcript_59517/g.136515  ORF Transcript_59517/g.136515 Transcript_59517/m.136515 type:complete len:715 (-) Transcript_59517:582-2726(-)
MQPGSTQLLVAGGISLGCSFLFFMGGATELTSAAKRCASRVMSHTLIQGCLRWLRLLPRKGAAWKRVKSDPRIFHEDEGQEELLSVREHGSGVEKLLSHVGYNVELIDARAAAYDVIKDMPPMPELDYIPSRRYAEASAEEVLYPLIEKSACLLVPGAYFGDEGKGKTVDAIARHPAVKVVARVNSGENAGHTVIGENGVKYDFHLCPSGLLTPGKVNVVGPECVMDPVSFMEREVSQLLNTGVPYIDRLFIGNVHLVCPHHKLLDLIRSWESPNSSTLQGMGPVHASKASRLGLRLDHLFNPREGPQGARHRLEQDMQVYWGALKALGVGEAELLQKAKANSKIQEHVLAFIEAEDKAGYVLDLFDRYVVTNRDFPPRADVSHLLRHSVARGDKVLLEGPQSYFLSNAAEKVWDSGTSANTDASGMLCASRLNLTADGIRPLVINVHKTPGSSRVGSGANPCSFVPQHYFSSVSATKFDFETMAIDWRRVNKQYFATIQPNGVVAPGKFTNSVGTFDLGVAMAAATCIHPSHREFGVTSGRPRVVGFFDCVAQAEMIQVQGPYCSISAFDRGDDYDEYGVCIAYVFVHPQGSSLFSNGREFKSGTIIKAGEQLPTQQVLYFCQPIVKKVRGWRDTPIFARSSWWRSQQHPVVLPEPVCELLDIIEHFSGTQVISIGNGPKGDEIIYIRPMPVESTISGAVKGFARRATRELSL